MFPTAMLAAARADGARGRLTRKAAMATPGQTRRPRIRNATSATPVGGQTGVTWCPTRASCRPKTAAR